MFHDDKGISKKITKDGLARSDFIGRPLGLTLKLLSILLI
jgi:hypothetical protein